MLWIRERLICRALPATIACLQSNAGLGHHHPGEERETFRPIGFVRILLAPPQLY